MRHICSAAERTPPSTDRSALHWATDSRTAQHKPVWLLKLYRKPVSANVGTGFHFSVNKLKMSFHKGVTTKYFWGKFLQFTPHTPAWQCSPLLLAIAHRRLRKQPVLRRIHLLDNLKHFCRCNHKRLFGKMLYIAGYKE